MLERAHLTAKQSGVLDRIIASTDDFEALAVAQSIGLEAPFVRPAHLSGDTTPMLDVALHALDELETKGDHFDAVMVLQPTSPLRKPYHIRLAIGLLGAGDSVCSVLALPLPHCPHYVMRVTEDGRLAHFLPEGQAITRRQDVPQAYVRDGTIYLTRTDALRRTRSFYGEACVPMVLQESESLSIDTEEDWRLAELRLQQEAA